MLPSLNTNEMRVSNAGAAQTPLPVGQETTQYTGRRHCTERIIDAGQRPLETVRVVQTGAVQPALPQTVIAKGMRCLF